MADNVSSHKVQCVHEMIQKAGARLVYLPPYHPELHPIEQMWSKIKIYLGIYQQEHSAIFQVAMMKNRPTQNPTARWVFFYSQGIDERHLDKLSGKKIFLRARVTLIWKFILKE